MSMHILRGMEQRLPAAPYYPLKNPVFASVNYENVFDKDDLADEDFQELKDEHPIEKEERKQVKIFSRFKGHTIYKDESPVKYEEEVKRIAFPTFLQPDNNVVALVCAAVTKTSWYILGLTFKAIIWIIDTLISFCVNKGVQEVAVVTCSVVAEIFVVLVFALSTVFATILVNIDESYRRYHDVRFDGNIRPERIADICPPVSYAIPKTKPLRLKKEPICPNASSSVFLSTVDTAIHSQSTAEITDNDSCSCPVKAESPALVKVVEVEAVVRDSINNYNCSVTQDSPESEKPTDNNRTQIPSSEENDDVTSRELKSHEYDIPVSKISSKAFRFKLPTIEDSDELGKDLKKSISVVQCTKEVKSKTNELIVESFVNKTEGRDFRKRNGQKVRGSDNLFKEMESKKPRLQDLFSIKDSEEAIETGDTSSQKSATISNLSANSSISGESDCCITTKSSSNSGNSSTITECSNSLSEIDSVKSVVLTTRMFENKHN